MQKLELVRGGNFLYSTEHVELSDGSVSANTDRKKLRDNFLAICFLKIYNLKRYLRLLKQLQESAYLGRYKYPKMTVDVYDTLIRLSGNFNSVGERYRQNLTRNQGRVGGTNRRVEVSFAQAETGGVITRTA